MTKQKAELIEKLIAKANAEGRNLAGEAAERAWRGIRRNGDPRPSKTRRISIAA